MKELPILYEDKAECCGCFACQAVCPKGAIRMLEDEEGFVYPVIEREACVRCWKCVQSCPCNSELAER